MPQVARNGRAMWGVGGGSATSETSGKGWMATADPARVAHRPVVSCGSILSLLEGGVADYLSAVNVV